MHIGQEGQRSISAIDIWSLRSSVYLDRVVYVVVVYHLNKETNKQKSCFIKTFTFVFVHTVYLDFSIFHFLFFFNPPFCFLISSSEVYLMPSLSVCLSRLCDVLVDILGYS